MQGTKTPSPDNSASTLATGTLLAKVAHDLAQSMCRAEDLGLTRRVHVPDGYILGPQRPYIGSTLRPKGTWTLRVRTQGGK